MFAEPCYTATIDNCETGRILDIACNQQRDTVTIVTAGMDLQVWKRLPMGRFVTCAFELRLFFNDSSFVLKLVYSLSFNFAEQI